MSRNDEAERREVEDLLPWHAAGTLSHKEAQRVEAMLARDPELARRYELAREELAGTIHLNETLGAPSARAMEKLFAKIDAEPVRRPRRAPAIGARISGFIASLSPATLAWAAVAGAFVIMLQAGVIGSGLLKEEGGGGFVTASAPGAGGGKGSFVLIRFAPQASAADVTAFLEAHKASIAGGPSGGFYRVRVAEQVLPKDKLTSIINDMSKDRVVGFIAATK